MNKDKEAGTALGLVLVFVTILGVWLMGSSVLQGVSYSTVQHSYSISLNDNNRAIKVATVLAQLYRQKSCDASTLPKGYTCTSSPDSSTAYQACEKEGKSVFEDNNGKHLGEIKNASFVEPTFENHFYINNDEEHVHVKIGFRGTAVR